MIIAKNDFKPTYSQFNRDSSFQKNDIQGAHPKVLIPKKQNDIGFNLSTFVEPIPEKVKFVNKISNPLYHDDIEGSKPKSN